MNRDDIEPPEADDSAPSFSARDDVAAIESLLAFGVLTSALAVLWASGVDLWVAVVCTAIFGTLAASFLIEVLGSLYRRMVHPSSTSDDDFDALVAEVEANAGRLLDPRDPDHFERIVQQALDDLPEFMRSALEANLAVIVSDQGADHHAYGMYHGDGIAFDTAADRILIFRDTLIESFGDDANVLREQVRTTVLHELAHHLGADEDQVRALGL